MFEITLNAPGMNALGSDLMNFLIDQLQEADGRPVLVTGTGDAFSAGLNLKELTSLDPAGMEEFLLTLERMVERLYTYPAPTVALVNGHAIAGGCVVALCCDYRVAAANPRAKIGLNEVAIGVRFPPLTLKMVRARVPRRYQEDVLLGAGLHSPTRAAHLGLIDEVSEDAETVAKAKLAALSRHPPAAYAATKRDLRGDVSLTQAELDTFVGEVLPLWSSPALLESLRAHLKR